MNTFFKNHPWLLRGLLLGCCVLFFFVSFYVYIAYLLPLPPLFTEATNHPTTKIFDRHGELLYEILQPESGKKTLVALDAIPQHFIHATLAAEDRNFYAHPGVDIGAIARALFFNFKEQRIVSGGSTITQQLVRNISGNRPNRDLWDKMVEAMYAVRLSHIYNKDEILELYLNKIYYGNFAYGAQSAAQAYVGKNLSDIDLAEASFIAGLPQSPSAYNPYIYFDKAKKRQKYVLDQMVKQKFITEQEAVTALAEPITLRSNKFRIKAPHFVHNVVNELEEKFGDEMVTHGGLSVTTTLDYNLQLKAEQIVARRVDALKKNDVTNGALLAMDVASGQILVWVGSKDYFDESIDGAVDMVHALRQPGSALKPFTYLAALEKGYTPATILYDIPTEFTTETGPYAPKNYDLKYHGPVRLRTALASSYNIPAVKTLEFVGISEFMVFLKKMGINTLHDAPSFYGLALTLGGGEVEVIDMANAYNVIANYGMQRTSSTLLSIKDDEGQELYTWNLPTSRDVLGQFGKEHAYQIIDILKDPLARLPGFGEGSVLELSRPAAVKTGTTRNFRDNWTVGFTPELLTAVWVGNADASPMQNISGVTGAAPIWADFMETALQSKPASKFVIPSRIHEIEICALSGMLPSLFCNEKIGEIFVKGFEPREIDNYYQNFWIEMDSGHIIPDACKNTYNPLTIKQKVLVAYPIILQKWATENGLQLPPMEHCNIVFDYSNAFPDGYPNGEAKLISIDTPRNNDEYMLDSTLPISSQKVPLRATIPLNTQEVRYYVNGKILTTQKVAPFDFLWLPEKGHFSLYGEATLLNGEIIKSSSITFEVK